MNPENRALGIVFADVFQAKASHRAKCKAVREGTWGQGYPEVEDIVRAVFYTQFHILSNAWNDNSNWVRERVEIMHCININHKTWNGYINITQSELPNKNCLLDKVQRALCQGQESRGEVRRCCQLNHNEDSEISSCGHDFGQCAGRARKQQRPLSDEKCEGFSSSDQPFRFMKLKHKRLSSSK